MTSYLLSLGPVYGVSTVGLIPPGIPAPRLPDLTVLPAFAVDSFAIAIVSFAITLSLAKLYATKHKYELDANQELRALGCSNIFGGFFQCFPSAASLGRTAVQTSIGGETQASICKTTALVCHINILPYVFSHTDCKLGFGRFHSGGAAGFGTADGKSNVFLLYL